MAGSLEGNKIAAAILTAGIVGAGSSVLSGILYHPHELEEPVYVVEAAAPAGGEAEAPAGGEEAQPIGPLLAAASAESGESIANKCGACHSFEQGGANKVGPNLFGVVDEQIATGKGGYPFSDALKAKSSEKWTVENLNHWLYKPQGFAKGTKMTFAGLPKAEDRASMVKYLESLK
jgi:cytochrome c